MKKAVRTGAFLVLPALALTLLACSPSIQDTNAAAAQRAEVQARNAMLRVNPRFAQATADYSAQVERLRTTEFTPREEQVGLTFAVNRLADAIELVPHAEGLSLDAAASVVRNYAPTNVLGTSVPVANRDNINALRAASAVLLGIANGPYISAPNVKTQATRFQREVDAIALTPPIQRRGAVLGALQRADDTLRAIEIAVARGQVMSR